MKKIIHWLSHWGGLYILAGIFIGALYWEEKLPITLGDHKFLAIGMLFGFGFLVNAWINVHETEFLASDVEELQKEMEISEHHQVTSYHSENMQ